MARKKEKKKVDMLKVLLMIGEAMEEIDLDGDYDDGSSDDENNDGNDDLEVLDEDRMAVREIKACDREVMKEAFQQRKNGGEDHSSMPKRGSEREGKEGEPVKDGEERSIGEGSIEKEIDEDDSGNEDSDEGQNGRKREGRNAGKGKKKLRVLMREKEREGNEGGAVEDVGEEGGIGKGSIEKENDEDDSGNEGNDEDRNVRRRKGENAGKRKKKLSKQKAFLARLTAYVHSGVRKADDYFYAFNSSSVLFPRFYCNNCRCSVLPGSDRFHCLECNDFDLCSECNRKDINTLTDKYAKNKHKHSHHVVKAKTRSSSSTSSFSSTSSSSSSAISSSSSSSSSSSFSSTKEELNAFLRQFVRGPSSSSLLASSSSSSSSHRSPLSLISLISGVNWVSLAIEGLQALCVQVFGVTFDRKDEEDIISLIGDFWYAFINRNKSAMQAIINYPTTYWLELYAASDKVCVFSSSLFFPLFYITLSIYLFGFLVSRSLSFPYLHRFP
jgi:hypothetical protein